MTAESRHMVRDRRLSPRGAVMAVVLSLGFVAPAAATQIFADGFDECGFGRWSAGTFDPPPAQLTELTAEALATSLGACAPSLQSAQLRLANGGVPDATALSEITNLQTAVLHHFGTGGIVPRTGGSMAALSTGRARDANSPDFSATTPGTSYGRWGTAPASYLAAHGGALPHAPGCESGTNANDSVMLRLTFTVPDEASELVFDWMFLTADYPTWVCTTFTDFFLALVDGSSILLPADGNVALDTVEGNPVNINFQAAVLEHCATCPGGPAPLAGTGYDSNGGTGWHTARVPVVGGETLTLDLMIFDVGDTDIDSLVLLDGLRWVTQ